MTALRIALKIVCLIVLSTRQTINAFRLWDMFSIGSDPSTTTEEYTYISVDKQDIPPGLSIGQSNPDKKYVNEALNHGDNIDDLQKLRIRATKIVTREITRRVTVNPICVTARADVPTCFQDDVINDAYSSHAFDSNIREEFNVDSRIYDKYMEPSKEIKTLGSHLNVKDEMDADRDPKYFYYHQRTPELPKKSTKIKEQLQIAEISVAVAEARNRYQNSLKKQVVQTIWVTKVQKFTNYDVTATLIVDNCIPYGVKYPICVEKSTQSVRMSNEKIAVAPST